MRLLLAVLVFGSLALVACGGGDAGQTNAFKATLEYFGDDPAQLPQVGTDYICGITVAERPPSPAPTIPPVVATCRWDMERVEDTWRITFREAWPCGDFNRVVPPYPTCSPTALGTHQWDFLVDASLHVAVLSDEGNFAPDMPR